MFLSKFGTGAHGELAEAIDFDGTNDYLSRSSDLVGNADGKTFTFSAWVWLDSSVSSQIIFGNASSISTLGNGRFRVSYDSGNLKIDAANSVNTTLFTRTGSFPLSTWAHMLISVNTGSTGAQGALYINDLLVGAVNVSSAGFIDFTKAFYAVGTGPSISNLKGRVAHVYLDYTYRDLSVESNRRLFITADRKPADGQAALNPILYLPLNDPTQPGKNLGTGGDFSLNGVVARSGRGPNQYNTPYANRAQDNSMYRGSALTGAINGKAATLSLWTSANDTGSDGIFCIGNSTLRFVLEKSFTVFTLSARSAAGTTVLTATWPMVAVGRNAHVIASFDLTNASNRHVFVNGVSQSVTWSTYLNTDVEFSRAEVVVWDKNGSNPAHYNGKIGDLWFNTSYIDLSVPANLAKFVTGTGIDAKPVDLGANGERPLGTAPLIYLPMYANNAGKNYGTGGDFTVNPPAPTGARGPNEFWGNKAASTLSTSNYLGRTSALSGVSDGTSFSMSFWYQPLTSAANRAIFTMTTSGGTTRRFWIARDSSNQITILGNASNGGGSLQATVTSPLVTNAMVHVLINVDLTNTANRSIYINGTQATVTWSTYINRAINFSVPDIRIGADSSDGGDCQMSEFYFTTDYIDFSEEANRLKFRDAFGNPTNLPALIEAGEVPNPAIYMRFDPANFGKNSGTGGDFTVYGTITDGGQL